MQKNEQSKNLNQNFFINLNSGDNNSFNKLKKIKLTINNNNKKKIKFNSILSSKTFELNEIKNQSEKNLISPSKLNENNLTNFTNKNNKEKPNFDFFAKKTKSTYYKSKKNDFEIDDDSNRMFIKKKQSKNDGLTLLNRNHLFKNIDATKEKKASKLLFSSIQKKIINKSQEKKINNRLNDILKKYFNFTIKEEPNINNEFSIPNSTFKVISRKSMENFSPTNLINYDKNSYYHSDNSSNL
jgi:hypothetical protein